MAERGIRFRSAEEVGAASCFALPSSARKSRSVSVTIRSKRDSGREGAAVSYVPVLIVHIEQNLDVMVGLHRCMLHSGRELIERELYGDNLTSRC